MGDVVGDTVVGVVETDGDVGGVLEPPVGGPLGAVFALAELAAAAN